MKHEETDNIRFMRLDTGENIIARVTTNENGIDAYLPLLVLIDMDDIGRPVLQLIEWIPVSLVEERACQIDKNKVVLNLTPTFFMKKTYTDFVAKLEKAEKLITNNQQQDSYSDIEEMVSNILNKRTLH